MNKVDELVNLVRSGKGRVMIVTHDILLRNKPVKRLPVSMELQASQGKIMLHTHFANEEIKASERARYASVFKSRRRSQVRIAAQLADNVKVVIHFSDEKPSLRESEERNGGEYVQEMYRVSHLEIDGDSASIANHFVVSRGYGGGLDDSAEAHAIIPGARFCAQNSVSKKQRMHPFHPSPLSSESYSSLIGETCGYRYCIEPSNGDLVFSIKSTSATSSTDPDIVLESIMSAAGFISGFHPWPFYRVTKKGRSITKHTLVAPSNTQTNWHNPLADKASGDCQHHISMINRMSDLLSSNNPEARTLNYLIWVAKQPCRLNVPAEVQLLTACAVIEGLRKPYDQEFGNGTKKHAAIVKKYGAPKKAPMGKLKFEYMFKSADIPWRDVGKPIFDTWNKYRHVLAHGFIPRKGQTMLNNQPALLASLVRITCGIQIYLLRKANYTGPVRTINRGDKYSHVILRPTNSLKLRQAILPSPSDSP